MNFSRFIYYHGTSKAGLIFQILTQGRFTPFSCSILSHESLYYGLNETYCFDSTSRSHVNQLSSECRDARFKIITFIILKPNYSFLHSTALSFCYFIIFKSDSTLSHSKLLLFIYPCPLKVLFPFIFIQRLYFTLYFTLYRFY